MGVGIALLSPYAARLRCVHSFLILSVGRAPRCCQPPAGPFLLQPYDTPLLPWTGTAPDRRPFRVYPVFDSREKAERFARRAYQQDTGDIGGSALEQLLNNIRRIEPNETPPDHDVSLNGDVPVKWSELTGDDAPPVA
jgi:hypothetical protein